MYVMEQTLFDDFRVWSPSRLFFGQRCNGSTAGLGYLKVGIDCPCKSPSWWLAVTVGGAAQSHANFNLKHSHANPAICVHT